MIENAYREGTTEAPVAAGIPGAVCQDQKTSPTTTVTTSGHHPDVSVHVEQVGSAATASTRQLDHNVKRERETASDAKSNQGVAGEEGACSKCKRKCSCITRLKSCLYSLNRIFLHCVRQITSCKASI